MMYVFEKGVSMPLCAVINDVYFNYFDGSVIDNINIIRFIMNGLKNKSMEIQKSDLKIYEICEYILPTHDKVYLGYNYCLNGASNYLDCGKQPFQSNVVNLIKKKLMDGEYFQELIWGEEYE